MGLLKAAFRKLPPEYPAWVLPPQTIGVSTEHTALGGTLSVGTSHLIDAIHAIGIAIAACGVRRLVISNSHGGNLHAADSVGRTLRKELGLLVVKSHYFLFPRPEGVALPESEWRHGLHGGALETAMMLHLRPELVKTSLATDARSLGMELEQSLRLVGPETPGASFSWVAEDLNCSGVAGDATLADAAMGKRIVEWYGGVLADVIRDAREFPIDRLKR